MSLEKVHIHVSCVMVGGIYIYIYTSLMAMLQGVTSTDAPHIVCAGTQIIMEPAYTQKRDMARGSIYTEARVEQWQQWLCAVKFKNLTVHLNRAVFKLYLIHQLSISDDGIY